MTTKYFFIAAYGDDAYGACTYGVDSQTCATTTTPPPTPGAPNTGLAMLLEPQVLLPLIVGLSLMAASLIYLVKRILRRRRYNENLSARTKL